MKKFKKLISSLFLIFVLFVSFIGLFSCQSKVYNISLNVDGNIYETITTNDSNLSDAPDKDGYTFNGWYLDNDLWQSSFSADKISSVTEDTTIYAKYELINYTITYQNTKDATNTNVTTYNVESDTFTLADLSVSGFVFNGWYSDDKKVTSIEKGTVGNLTFTASWNDNKLNIKYNEEITEIKTSDVISASLFEATCTNINNEAVAVTATTSDELVGGKTISVTLTATDNGYTESKILKVKVYDTPSITSKAVKYLYKDNDLSLLFDGFDSFNEKIDVSYTVKNGSMDTPGAITLEATAKDVAGNTNVEEFTYTVLDETVENKFLVNETGNCITGLKPSEVSTLTDTTELIELAIPYEINSKLITEIGKKAFRKDLTIKSVVLPSCMKILNEEAFYYCTNLEEINFLDGLTSIGRYCFDSCKLKNINVPDSVTNIEYGAFIRNASLEEARVSNELSFMGDYVFAYCTSLTSVNIPLSLSGIPVRSFYQCAALKSIVLPDNISVIENYAFTDCTSLENVTLPKDFFRFGKDVFSNTAWQNNLIAETEGDIIYLDKLAYLYIGDSNPDFTTFTIKEGTIGLASNTFNGCTWLESIVLPESIEFIGNSVFYNCTNLQSITFNNRITYIGAYSFQNCSKLNNVVIPDSVNEIDKAAFKNCTALTNIIISENVTELYNQVFYGCKLLTDVTLPENLTIIGESAFERCYALVSIDLPSNIESIGSYAFKDCQLLENITLPETMKTLGIQAFYRCYKLETINLPDNIEIIKESAFQYCSVLSSIVLPKNLTVINKYTFANCPLLSSVTFNDGLTQIKEFAFNRASVLNNLLFPSSLEFIGESAFQINDALTSVTLPEKITELSYKAFAYCPLLASVTLNEGLTKIGGLAFDECRALASIVLPSTLEEIGTKAFHECDSLTSVSIPSSVKSIGELAFANCNKLATIEITDNTLIINKDAFSNTPWRNNQTADEYGVIYLGKIAYDFVDTTLEDASINIILKNDTLAIASNAFESITKSLTITIPESVKVINSNAFSNSTGLTQIFIPKTVLEVKDTIFAGLEETITIYLEAEAIPTNWNTDWAKNIATENIILNATGLPTEETE